MIDLHCHILPGIDDGAKSFEEALEMAKIAEEDGIEVLVATPHLFRENSGNEDFGEINKKRKKLNQELKKNHINVKILSGAEVHISHNLIEQIKMNKNQFVINQSSYMFLEFPSDHVFYGVKNLIFELLNEGIFPIIAHPERNSVFAHNPSLLFDLIQMGALSQSNSGSFLGLYGSKSKESALDFLDLNFTHFIASDSHNTKLLAPRLSPAIHMVASRIGEKKANFLVEDNPKAVLENREIPHFFAPADPRTKNKSLKVKIPRIFRKNRD